MESTRLNFAQRPNMIPNLRNDQPVNLVSNYMKITLKSNDKAVSQYHLTFIPEVASDNDHLRRGLIQSLRPKLREFYYPHAISGNSLYSANRNVGEETRFTLSYPNQEGTETIYEIVVRRTENTLDLTNYRTLEGMTQNVKTFLEIVIKNILNANRGMVRFNKSCIYNYELAVQLQDVGKFY